MPIQRCEYCNITIDLDENVDHFLPEDDKYECVIEEEDNQEDLINKQ